jgi:hypothetical protein
VAKKVAGRRVEHWMDVPEEHDYPAASDYLSLLLHPTEVEAAVAALHQAPLVRRKAKDLLRASGLPALPRENVQVARDLNKVARGAKLSPVLLLRGDAHTGQPLLIADGYHRVCASWLLDENADIPCRLAVLPERPAKPTAKPTGRTAKPASGIAQPESGIAGPERRIAEPESPNGVPPTGAERLDIEP